MYKDNSLDLKQIIWLIKKKWLIIVLIPVIFMGISGLVSFFIIPREFEAKTTIIIGRAPSGDTVIQYDEVLMYEKIVKTYSEIASSRRVAEKTLQRLHKNIPVETFLNEITVTQEPDTQIMTISVKRPNAEEAMDMANNIAEVFIEESNTLYPVANIQIIDKAYLPQTPAAPNIKFNVIIAFCFGIIVSIGTVFISDYFKYTCQQRTGFIKR